MPEIFCRIYSPVHIMDEKKSLPLPVIYSKKLYVVQNKLLFEVLSRIGFLQDYIKDIRESNFQDSVKWLSKKKLLNEEFLESVSHYWINDINVRKITNYNAFLKDVNNNPVLTGEYLKNLFRKALLFCYIRERIDEFNIYVSNELDFVEKELGSIGDISTYYLRQNVYKKGIFKLFLEHFLVGIEENLSNYLQEIENLRINLETPLNKDDLGLYKVGSPVDFKNLKLYTANNSQKECLKENTSFRLDIQTGRFSTSKIDENEFLDFLFFEAELMAKTKLSFDRDNLIKFVSSEPDPAGIASTLNCINNCMNFIRPERSSGLSKKQIAVLEKSECLSLNTRSKIADYFTSIRDANLLICSNDELNKIICLLNLSNDNILRINELMFGKNSKVEYEIINLAMENYTPHMPLGYAKISQ